MKQCETAGCRAPASGFSTLCAPHKQAMRRHGHPAQTSVTVHELRPYVARVKARQAKNKESDAWSLLEGRWEALRGHCRAVVERYASGGVSIRHERMAAHQVTTLADAVPADKVVQTALAMYLLAQDRPTRFQSDRAFRFELVRRVRGLSDVNAGTYWDQKAGRSRRVYRDLPPRVMEVLGAWLAEAFGGAGLVLASKEREDAERVAQEHQRLAVALGGLQ
jgi:hypothetical protein